MSTDSVMGNNDSAFVKPNMPPRKDSKTGCPEALPSRPPVSPITPSASLARLAAAPATVHPPLPSQLDGSQDEASFGRLNKNPRSATSRDESHVAQLSSSQSQHTQSQPPKPHSMPPPQPVPFEEDDNTDVVALRATLAILHHQKQTSERDIKTLQQLKRSLREDPTTFTEELVSGKMREDRRPEDPLYATFATDDRHDDTSMSDDEPTVPADTSQYPKIPTKQNVVRCPPINWSKYHIVGEPLEKMHEEQLKRPTQGEPSHGAISTTGNPYFTPASAAPALAPEHHVYKPYDPFTDSLADRDGVQTRRSSKFS